MNFKFFLIFLFNVIGTINAMHMVPYFSNVLYQDMIRVLFFKKNSKKRYVSFGMIDDNRQHRLETDFKIDYWQNELDRERKKEPTSLTQMRIEQLEAKIQEEKDNKLSLLQRKEQSEDAFYKIIRELGLFLTGIACFYSIYAGWFK